MAPGTRVARRAGGRRVDGYGTSSRLEHWCSARPRQRDAGYRGAVCSRKDKPCGQDVHCRRGGSRNPHVGRFPLLSDRGFGPITALNRNQRRRSFGRSCRCWESGPSGASQAPASALINWAGDNFGLDDDPKPRLRDFTVRKPFCPSLVVPQPQSCSVIGVVPGERGV